MAFLAPLLKQHFEDENGNPLSGGFVYTYVANSTTPIATYLDPEAESANENPIELDSRGECVIYIQQGTAYKFVVQNAAEETIYTIDDVALSEFSETGEPGAPGEAATIAVGTVNSVLYGEPATVTNVGTSSAAIFNFEIPWGETGAQGENGAQGSQGIPGEAATITIGTVDTVPFEDPATVTNSGTTTEAIFDFEIPQGADGATGAAGTSIHTGSGVPSGGLGNDGDVYIDADTGEIYDKASGSWTLRGEITGGIVGTDITGKTANTTPATDDLLVMSDTSDSGNLKKITLSDLFGAFLPAGMMTPYAGSSAPSGWLLCYGQAVSRSTYATLFTAISTAFGVGDGSTTFNLPDLRGRIPVGKDNMGGSAASRMTSGGSGVDGATLGASGGAQTVTLTSAEMPSHTHTQDAHTHTQNTHSHAEASAGTFRGTGGALQVASGSGTGIAGSASTGSTVATNQNTTATNQNTGGGGAHNNTQPSLIVNYIIKT